MSGQLGGGGGGGGGGAHSNVYFLPNSIKALPVNVISKMADPEQHAILNIIESMSFLSYVDI